ncbi:MULTISPECIES: DUF2516 family protein [unclassified Modestobacter]|uniref:DUF2516 family protein n=1 Tax=unclassified Modestobacter TaxID=2643866 RepID=UPI0022AB0262|nr:MULTISPECIES: DUF2516 family protein [unclassified Modestobacter]MCZ2811445.1 DUF2516 family protein [Modestobacter sp. VKM Ac-2979]MCZ2840959.1 DUF2516 family protein [Modestobacter sp. VKM Ac-2980]MCZ2848243.1 DUF2516 family protein [Modestobacter sp. VKM Ac-2978]
MAGIDGLINLVVFYATLALAVWAFIDAIIRPAAAFVAAGKLSKPGWMAITGIATLVLLWQGPLSFLGLPAVIAAVVYLVDVRPAVRELPRGNSNW